MSISYIVYIYKIANLLPVSTPLLQERPLRTVHHTASGDTTTVRTINSPEATPVDLLEMGGSPILKRLVPLVGVGLLAAVLTWWLLRRRSAR